MPKRPLQAEVLLGNLMTALMPDDISWIVVGISENYAPISITDIGDPRTVVSILRAMADSIESGAEQIVHNVN